MVVSDFSPLRLTWTLVMKMTSESFLRNQAKKFYIPKHFTDTFASISEGPQPRWCFQGQISYTCISTGLGSTFALGLYLHHGIDDMWRLLVHGDNNPVISA